MARQRWTRGLAALGLGLLAATLPTAPATAATPGPDFVDDYTVTSLDRPTGLPGNVGGLTLKAGDPNTLLIGGNANTAGGAIYAVPLVRGSDGRITGYAGDATLVATAPYIDGGLAYFPGTEVLAYATYPSNQIGQILPGGAEAARIDDLATHGVTTTTGTLNFVQSFAPGAGQLRVLTYGGGTAQTLPYSLDTARGDGTYAFGTASAATALGLGAEGIEDVPPGSPGFPDHSVVVSDYISGRIYAYEVDADGVLLPDTRRVFIDELQSAMGAYLDPVSGSFLFSAFSTTAGVTVVDGFASANPVDLGLTKLASATEAVVGQEVTYTLEVTNHGPGTSLATTVTDDLPDGARFVSATGDCAHEAGTVTCAVGPLEAGSSDDVAITVALDSAGEIVNEATVALTRFDQVAANNLDRATVTVTEVPATTTTTTTTEPAPTTTTTAAPSTTDGTSTTSLGSTTTTAGSVAGADEVTPGALPRTGSDPSLAALGAVLVTLGLAAVLRSRRRLAAQA